MSATIKRNRPAGKLGPLDLPVLPFIHFAVVLWLFPLRGTMLKSTRQLRIGTVPVGGGAPVTVQSMTNTDTRDVAATVAQIHQLAEAGCEIVRCAVPDQQATVALAAIRRDCPLPLIADIHFDYQLALASLAAGVDGLRLNPGNIGVRWKVEEVVRACRERQVPIRIGVNAGSLEPELLAKYGHPTAAAMVE